jgi:colanic acid/amylovoran biosynthesis glycosyltransferase
MYNQVKYLSELAEVHVVCDRTRNLDQFPVPIVHSLESTSLLQFIWEKSIRKLLLPRYHPFMTTVAKKIGAHVLHSHFGPIGWTDANAAKRVGMKHIVTYYGYDVKMLPMQNKRWLSRYMELFDKAHLFLCEGPHMAKELVMLGCPQEKVKVHHLGIEVENIPYKPRRWQDGEPLRVLIAASFREKKGIPYALKALAELQHELPLEITIIGDSDSEQRSKTEKQHILGIIENCGLKSKSRLLGYQPYSVFFEEAYKHHIFISPSVTAADGDTEGGAPISLIEMIATGMPVISTLHCDIPEVVQYGVKDWLVEERDITGLVNKLQWLVKHVDEWEKLLITGRSHVEAEYDARQQGRKLINIYREALQM